jgi:hypothetical protein
MANLKVNIGVWDRPLGTGLLSACSFKQNGLCAAFPRRFCPSAPPQTTKGGSGAQRRAKNRAIAAAAFCGLRGRAGAEAPNQLSHPALTGMRKKADDVTRALGAAVHFLFVSPRNYRPVCPRVAVRTGSVVTRYCTYSVRQKLTIRQKLTKNKCFLSNQKIV